MEFFGEVYSPDLDLSYLKNLLDINNLPGLCASISTVDPKEENEANIYCIWGAFYMKREELRYGVRFSLVNCPHALAWTITFNEQSENIIIHCTIDKTEADEDFVDSIDEFVMHWSKGLFTALTKVPQPTQKNGEVKL